MIGSEIMNKKVENLVTFMKNIKLELIITILYLIFMIIKSKWSRLNSLINLQEYFSQDRLNGITAFFAITIGVYITVITILATTEIGISRKMLERRLDKPLIDVIMFGIIEDFLTVASATFLLGNIVYDFLPLFIILSLISFAKFIYLLMLIFKANMEQMAKAIDEKDRYDDDLLETIKLILMAIRKDKR